MPIVIKRFPEPLCTAPFTPEEEREARAREGRVREPNLGVAGSRARDSLRSLMLRYCQRKIAGRSVLIAGHRGAGKTTVVKSVIDELYQLPPGEMDARPLFVYLHGPDLVAGVGVLGGEKKTKEEAGVDATNVIVVGDVGAAQGDGEQGSDAPPTPLDHERLATAALQQLTVALHQAFSTHLGWRMQSAAREKRNYEEAAQFRLDLDRQMEVSDLALYWERMGVLERGLLRDPAQALRTYRATQGSLEIVALASLGDAYTRAIAKDVEESEGQELEDKRERKQAADKSRDRKELTNTIAGLLSGGVAGAGAVTAPGVSAPMKVVVASLAFTVASVLTSGLLNLMTLRSFSQKRSKERKVVYDDSLGSLELMVPLLIHRVQDAGLAPIFVVDELDKVDELEDKMDTLLKQLKHVVADKAFCCFLVDREYYEKVRNWEWTPGKSTGLTFFGERLYVITRHQDWHKYLRSVLEVNEKNPLMEFAATVLRYVLLARSKMHAMDVRREMEKLPRSPDKEDEIAIPANEILTRPAYTNPFFYQMAVEFVLEDVQLAERLAADATFLQIAYDALYYPLRKWEKGEDPDWSSDALAEYLLRRTGVPGN